jgi:hypothetical protein
MKIAGQTLRIIFGGAVLLSIYIKDQDSVALWSY